MVARSRSVRTDRIPNLEVASSASEDEEESLRQSNPKKTKPPHPLPTCRPHRTRTSTTRPLRSNHIQLHIYDLISSDTLVQLPCFVCEIGKCFNDVNAALHELGTGAYHVGVDVNGIEYAFGATSIPGKSGVFSCIPKLSPGYQYRTTIDFGSIALKRRVWTPHESSFRLREEYVDGRSVIKAMATEFMGTEYDILRRNCCTFAYEACVRLGVPAEEIPTWFRNLAETGAYSQDVAHATWEPLAKVLSNGYYTAETSSLCGDDEDTLGSCGGGGDLEEQQVLERAGFEMIARRNATNTKDVVVVIHTDATMNKTALAI